MDAAAIAIDQRQCAPQGAVCVVFLVVVADGEQRAVTEIGVEDAVQHSLVVLVAVEIGILVLFDDQCPTAQVAGLVERAGNVGFQPVVVP